MIGSGPSGFYLTQALIKVSVCIFFSQPSFVMYSPYFSSSLFWVHDQRADVTVDIYEKYPVPFGLVRFGVAPDHPEVKNVINSFTKTANIDRVSFIGNVSIGSDITLSELRNIYDAVVLCYGSSRERKLNIPGEDLPNVISARKFVGWYNGVPSDQNLSVALNGSNCIVIGQGNVALDCARILLSPVNRVLDKTDITNASLQVLEKSTISTVNIIGRRGPLQVAFTIKELRELTKIISSEIVIDPSSQHLFGDISTESLSNLPRSRRRLTELLLQISQGKYSTQQSNLPPSSKQCKLHFTLSPKQIISTERNTLSVKFAKNILNNLYDEKSTIQETDEIIEIETDLVIKSLGYQTVALDPTIPMDEKKGCIKNVDGRVSDLGPGVYCSGWAATGPIGVLASTMNVSFDVAKNILQDIDTQLVKCTGNGTREALDLLTQRSVQYVTFTDWQKIDQWERRTGEEREKPREKLTNIDDMMNVIKNSK